MVVALTRLVGAATALPNAAKPLSVGGSGVTAVMLGGIAFDGFESPSKMPFGGSQKIAKQEIPGGILSANAMGGFEHNIEFSGTLFGPGASAKARKIDALRIAGGVLTLTWADFSRKVVIEEFHCDYTTRGQLLPYRISLLVLPPAQPGNGSSSTPTSGVSNLIGQASALSKLSPALSGLSSSLDSVQSAVPSTTPGLSQVNSAISSLNGISSNVQGILANAQSSINAFNNAGGVLASLVSPSGSTATDAVNGLTLMSAASRVQAFASSVNGLTGNAVNGLRFMGVT